ncbi:MAG: hypothetical protein GY715_05845 [Planctomycetes bacterium]|nr:hypothetical protein [Planctomycetota bacterium]
MFRKRENRLIRGLFWGTVFSSPVWAILILLLLMFTAAPAAAERVPWKGARVGEQRVLVRVEPPPSFEYCDDESCVGDSKHDMAQACRDACGTGGHEPPVYRDFEEDGHLIGSCAAKCTGWCNKPTTVIVEQVCGVVSPEPEPDPDDDPVVGHAWDSDVLCRWSITDDPDPQLVCVRVNNPDDFVTSFPWLEDYVPAASSGPQECAPETTLEGCVNCYVANWWNLAAAEPYPPTPQQAADLQLDAEGFCYAVQCLPLRGACPAPDCIGPRPVGCS